MKNLITKEEKDQIDFICKEYKIKNYTINSDGSIDVDGDVDLRDRHLIKLPLQFGKVSGNFSCNHNKLTTLKGSPVTVGKGYSCCTNKLISLVGGPVTVGGSYHCYLNALTTLEGAPESIGGGFFCMHNDLISIFSGDIDIDIIGSFDCNNNNKLPQQFLSNCHNKVVIKLILKYQRHFEIWNDDLTLNEENFKDLLLEIEEGLE